MSIERPLEHFAPAAQLVRPHLPLDFYPEILGRAPCPCGSPSLLCRCRLRAHLRAEMILETLRPLGVTHRTHGAHRLTYLHPEGWAIKVATSAAARRMNRAEVENYQSLPAKMRPYFPETYDLDMADWAILSARYDISQERYDQHQERVVQTATALGVRDLAMCNVGWRGDEFRFIDFAELNIESHRPLSRLGDYHPRPDPSDYWRYLDYVELRKRLMP